jgi:DNA-binding Xre family transcriptional regulator
MSLTGDFMRVLDEIRLSRQWTVTDLTADIVTERTYYRMLKADRVRTDIFSKLCRRMGIDISELIHDSAFVRRNDSRFKFLFRVHTKFYRDIEEHYQAIKCYTDSDADLDLLLQSALKRYEKQRGIIPAAEYQAYLVGLVPQLKANTGFNIYLFLVSLFYLDEFPNATEFSLKDLAIRLERESISYSVHTMAMAYDLLLELLMKSGMHSGETGLLVEKYGQVFDHFPSRYFLMRYRLYQAYRAMLQSDCVSMERFLFQFCMNAMSMLDSSELGIQFDLVRHVFRVDLDALVAAMTSQLLP